VNGTLAPTIFNANGTVNGTLAPILFNLNGTVNGTLVPTVFNPNATVNGTFAPTVFNANGTVNGTLAPTIFNANGTANGTTFAPTVFNATEFNATTFAPSVAPRQVTFTILNVTIDQVDEEFEATIRENLARTLNLDESDFIIVFSAGSVIAEVIFTDDEDADVHADSLADLSEEELSDGLGVDVDNISEKSVLTEEATEAPTPCVCNCIPCDNTNATSTPSLSPTIIDATPTAKPTLPVGLSTGLLQNTKEFIISLDVRPGSEPKEEATILLLGSDDQGQQTLTLELLGTNEQNDTNRVAFGYDCVGRGEPCVPRVVSSEPLSPDILERVTVEKHAFGCVSIRIGNLSETEACCADCASASEADASPTSSLTLLPAAPNPPQPEDTSIHLFQINYIPCPSTVAPTATPTLPDGCPPCDCPVCDGDGGGGEGVQVPSLAPTFRATVSPATTSDALPPATTFGPVMDRRRFMITLDVTFDSFERDNPIILSGLDVFSTTFVLQGLGPSYGDDMGKVAFFYFCKSGKGQSGTCTGATFSAEPLILGTTHRVVVVKEGGCIMIQIDDGPLRSERCCEECESDAEADLIVTRNVIVAGGQAPDSDLLGSVSLYQIEYFQRCTAESSSSFFDVV